MAAGNSAHARLGQMSRIDALLARGGACLRSGQFDEAAGAYAEAVRSDPTEAAAFAGLGQALAQAGEGEAALQAWVRALQLRPSMAPVLHALVATLRRSGQLARTGRMLDSLPAPVKEQPEWWLVRAEVELEQGEFDAARRRLAACDFLARNPAARSLDIRAMLYDPSVSPRDLWQKAREWGEVCGQARGDFLSRASIDPRRRLRIGFVTTRLHRHNCVQHLRGWLPHRDRTEAEIILIGSGAVDESTARELSGICDGVLCIGTLSDEEAVRRLRAERFDVLVDMNEHANGGRLTWFARRCAPVQVHYYSNAVTTGVPAMDWRITDPLAEPASLAEFSTERLLPLECGYYSYTPPDNAAGPTSVAPVEKDGAVTFGGLHHLAKYNDGVLRCYAEVLRRAPRARLRFVRDAFACPEIRAAFGRRCLAVGLAADRVQLEPDAAGDLSPFNRMDAMLDAWPFCGDATTGDALWMGVPVLTLRGAGPRGARAAAKLERVGRTDWICATPEEFVARAVEWAGWPAARFSEERRQLRADYRSHSDRQGPLVAKALLSAFRQIASRPMP